VVRRASNDSDAAVAGQGDGGPLPRRAGGPHRDELLAVLRPDTTAAREEPDRARAAVVVWSTDQSRAAVRGERTEVLLCAFPTAGTHVRTPNSAAIQRSICRACPGLGPEDSPGPLFVKRQCQRGSGL
jgi:hypothetical protein